ncbi:MAG: hypothetical protein GY835_03895 [bacterium]|nr:hypothetical protein [bacterium]
MKTNTVVASLLALLLVAVGFSVTAGELLLLFKYEKYVDSGRKPTRKVGDLPYFSNSSMSPVLAGIVAMMKEVDNSLPAAEYKRILVETSREIDYDGYQVGHVVDAARAVSYLLEMNARAPAEQGGEP